MIYAANSTTDSRPLTDHFDNLEGAINHLFKIVELDYKNIPVHDGGARYEDAKAKVRLYFARLMENTALVLANLDSEIKISELNRKTLENYLNNQKKIKEKEDKLQKFCKDVLRNSSSNI